VCSAFILILKLKELDDAETEGLKELDVMWERRRSFLLFGREGRRLKWSGLCSGFLQGFWSGGLSLKSRPSFGRPPGCSFQLKPKTRFLFKPNKPFSEVVLTCQGLMGPKPQPSVGRSLVMQIETQNVSLEMVLS